MRKIKLFTPYVNWRSFVNVIRVLRSGQLAEGPETKAFEKEFGDACNLKNVVAVNSGSSALELAYELAGLKEGDEVITTILTCTATNIPLARRKVSLVFADIDRDLNVDVQDVRNKMTDKTKAIVFVHFGGNNRGLKELLELAKEKNCLLIEDAAQAVGSEFWGKADYTAVSLQAIKTLTSGDGGFLICRDDEKYRTAKRLRWFGYDREEKQKRGDTDLVEAGYKYHMNDISAAIGRGNLRVLPTLVKNRQALMTAYASHGAIPGMWVSSYIVPNRRTELIAYLKTQGFETGMHHYRNDQYTIFGKTRLPLPVMNELEDRYILLPMHQHVRVADVHRLMGLIEKFYAVS